jgi:arsenite transporter
MRSNEEGVPCAESRVPRMFRVADRYVGLWLLGAMAFGLAVGHLVPGASDAVARVAFGHRNLLIVAGLVLMMYPPLARVQYEKLHLVLRDMRLLSLGVLQNWVIGPLLMFGLACLFFRDRPDFMVGLILIGLVRCIDSVIVWNDLAEGDCQYCVGLAGLNVVFQILFLPLYVYVFITVLPDYFGLGGVIMDAPMESLVRSELVYLIIPLVAGIASRFIGLKTVGEERYEREFVPKIAPLTLIAKVFTVAVLFSLKGGHVINLTMDVLHIALPLAIYFVTMFVISYLLSAKSGTPYEQATTLSFTAASSNFELALVVSIAVFGIGSGQAFVAAVGPMVEVPVILTLVYVALWLRGRLFPRRIECVGRTTIRHYRVCK